MHENKRPPPEIPKWQHVQLMKKRIDQLRNQLREARRIANRIPREIKKLQAEIDAAEGKPAPAAKPTFQEESEE